MRRKLAHPTPALGDERPADLPAFYCGHFGRKSKRTGKLCRAHVVEGTDACLNHAGRPLEEHRARGQIRLEAAQWTLDGHDGANLEPAVEILRLIAFWKWKANFYGQLLHQAYQAAEALRAAHQAQKILLAKPEEETRFNNNGDFAGILHEDPALQVARSNLEQIFVSGGVTALVGAKYDVDRDGRIFAVDEGIRALVTLEERAHTMVGKFCHLAVQAKVAESRIELAQTVGVMIQTVIIGVLREKGLSAQDADVQQLVVKHIDMVTSGPALLAA